MLIRREIGRVGERALVKIQFAGVSGQICSTTYELTGPNREGFTDRRQAEGALRRLAAAPGEGAFPGG